MNEISRIDIIVGGNHGQGAFRFLMKLLFVMKYSKNIERTSSVACILCKNRQWRYTPECYNRKTQKSFILILDPITIYNHQVYIDNLYITSDLSSLVMLLGEELSSPKWCFKCKLYPKVWLEHGHVIGED